MKLLSAISIELVPMPERNTHNIHQSFIIIWDPQSPQEFFFTFIHGYIGMHCCNKNTISIRKACSSSNFYLGNAKS